MPRTIAFALVLVVVLVAGPAHAGANIRVENSEVAGGKLTVKALNCQSGSGFTAVVLVELVDPASGAVLRSRRVDADVDGSTRLKIRIPGSTAPGTYTARVTCIHEFDAGGEGTFYQSTEGFEVLA